MVSHVMALFVLFDISTCVSYVDMNSNYPLHDGKHFTLSTITIDSREIFETVLTKLFVVCCHLDYPIDFDNQR